jgi:oligopeptide/dipeptide ABC transporter ATP-binding protein
VTDGKLLELDDLRVHFETEEGVLRAVDGVSLGVARGQTLAVVGESGSGKSVTAMTILGLTAAPHVQISGRVLFRGRDLAAGAEEARAVRGKEIAMVFQDPLTSLHPLHRVGRQIVEAIEAHGGGGDRAARRRAVELLELVGMPDPARRFGEYPHELSGGMRQRAMIAMALANEPKMLIADEPTTALDVTIQAQILRLIERLQAELGMAMILITHDLGVVAEVADEVAVMYAGRIVEHGPAERIFDDPQHPYTWGLLGSMTRADRPLARRLPQIKGQPPSLIALPRGCHFRPRCPHEFGRCREVPALEARSGDARHLDRCWLAPERKSELRTLADGDIGLEQAE